MRALKVARYCVEDGDVRGRYERVLDRFEALGPIELKGVADPVPLFRAASS
jgi:class 3 adenylate cyclase